MLVLQAYQYIRTAGLSCCSPWSLKFSKANFLVDDQVQVPSSLYTLFGGFNFGHLFHRTHFPDISCFPWFPRNSSAAFLTEPFKTSNLQRGETSNPPLRFRHPISGHPHSGPHPHSEPQGHLIWLRIGLQGRLTRITWNRTCTDMHRPIPGFFWFCAAKADCAMVGVCAIEVKLSESHRTKNLL